MSPDHERKPSIEPSLDLDTHATLLNVFATDPAPDFIQSLLTNTALTVAKRQLRITWIAITLLVVGVVCPVVILLWAKTQWFLNLMWRIFLIIPQLLRPNMPPVHHFAAVIGISLSWLLMITSGIFMVISSRLVWAKR